MSGLTSKPKKPKMPVIAATPAAPTPEELSPEIQRRKEEQRRRLMRAVGREGTILTQGTLGAPNVQKQTLLGLTG